MNNIHAGSSSEEIWAAFEATAHITVTDPMAPANPPTYWETKLAIIDEKVREAELQYRFALRYGGNTAHLRTTLDHLKAEQEQVHEERRRAR